MAEITGRLIVGEVSPDENCKKVLCRCRIVLDNVEDQVTLLHNGSQEDHRVVSLSQETVVLSMNPPRAFSLAVSVLQILGKILYRQESLKKILQGQD